jgi:uncharacterized membrane protein
MTAAMGLTGTLWVLLLALRGGIDFREAHTSQVILGCCLGVTVIWSIPVFLAAVARGDLSITWTILTLSFALVSLMVTIYPGERPTATGVTGLILAVGAVTLLGFDMAERHRAAGPGKPRKGWGFFMSLSFLSNALSLYAYSLAAEFQPDNAPVHKLTFLLTTYVVYGIGSLLLAFLVRRPGSVKAAFMTGSVAGTLLLAGGLFILEALTVGRVPGYVLYPVTTGGSNIFVVVLSVIFLKERPGRFGWTGIFVGLAALVLLGLSA